MRKEVKSTIWHISKRAFTEVQRGKGNLATSAMRFLIMGRRKEHRFASLQIQSEHSEFEPRLA
jgi:hypothetical protein